MNRIDFSIDIETLDTKPTSAILSIGCVAFDIVTGEILDRFCCKVDTEDAMRFGSVGASTLSWWINQSPEAKKAAFQGEGEYLAACLADLNAFIQSRCMYYGEELPAYPWGNGSSFDISILDHAYAHCGIGQVWDFRKVRDMRTLVDETEFDVTLIPSVGTHHNALDDAEWQAKVISAAWQRMRGCIERDRALATL